MYIALSSSGNSEKILQQKAEGILKKFAEDETSSNLEKMMSQGNLKKYSNLETSESQIRLVLNTPVLFDSGRAELKAETRTLLGGIARTLSMTSCPIVVEGHTDNVPIKSAEFCSNWELSARRAVNVINYFVKKGLPAERFIAAGYGEYFPRFPNDDFIQRQKNRRIEIVLLKEDIE
ncbi:MAG: flagellar motor protein MotB [Elusimicrobia bacterium]|nr:flagellar motor protein MotB [Elusimicrobiota bacterium]